jgi:hypothetical protein
MKNRCCLLALVLLLPLNVVAQSPAIILQIYDYAGLQASTLQAFAHRTHDILLETSLSIEINVCTATGCDQPPTSSRILVLRVVRSSRSKMNNARQRPLGQSFADRSGGTYALLFLKQVQEEAAEANVPWLTVLAYAAAHEIGHLLLGQTHSQRGLMKAYWDQRDFQAMNQNWLHFSAEQLKERAVKYGTNGMYTFAGERRLKQAHSTE